ncbi:DUF4199 domain-containing protein [bacterium]|nr:DUF4199 domain-containing protein [bacterium]
MEKFRPAIKFGAYMGLVNIFIFLLIYAIDPGFSATMMGGLVNMVLLILAVPIVFMILGARDCKPNFPFYSYGKALIAAFTVALVSAVIVFVFNVLFTEVIDPQYEENLTEQVLDNTRDRLENASMSDEQIDELLETTEARMSQNMGVMGKLKMTLFGLIWYLILALIIAAVQKSKKEDKVPTEEVEDWIKEDN